MVSITADGALANDWERLVNRMKNVQPKLAAYHCISHQSGLRSKLSQELAGYSLGFYNCISHE